MRVPERQSLVLYGWMAIWRPRKTDRQIQQRSKKPTLTTNKYGKMDENNTNVDHVTDTSQPCDPRCIIYIRSMEKVRLFMDVVNLGLSF